MEQLLIRNEITVPLFLQNYNKDRYKSIQRYKLIDKYGIFKIMYNENYTSDCNEIIDFHKVVYSKLISKIKEEYSNIVVIEKYNKNGSCNELPTVKGEDMALWRRIRVVDFPSKFIENPQQIDEFKIDITLPNKIREEITWKQTFMNILIDYYYKKIDEPDEVKVKTNEYKTENDQNMIFVESYLKRDDNEFITWSELYNNYYNWYSDKNGNVNIKKAEIKIYFENKIFKKKEEIFKHDKKTIRGWRGWIFCIDE